MAEKYVSIPNDRLFCGHIIEDLSLTLKNIYDSFTIFHTSNCALNKLFSPLYIALV